MYFACVVCMIYRLFILLPFDHGCGNSSSSYIGGNTDYDDSNLDDASPDARSAPPSHQVLPCGGGH